MSDGYEDMSNGEWTELVANIWYPFRARYPEFISRELIVLCPVGCLAVEIEEEV